MKKIIPIFLILSSQLHAQQENSYEKQVEELNNKTSRFYYNQKDSVYFYLNLTQNVTKEHNNWEHEFYTLINWNRQASYFYDLQTIKKNLIRLDSLIIINKELIDSSPNSLLLKNSLLYDKGNYYFELDDYENSRKFFDNIIDSTSKLPDSIISKDDKYLLSVSFSFIAKMYSNESKYDLAKQFYIKNSRFIKSKLPEDLRRLYRNQSLLSEVYKRQGDYKISNKILTKSIQRDFKDVSSINAFVTDGYHLVNNHIQLSQLDSAKYYLGLIKNKLPLNHAFKHKYHEAKALIHEKVNEYDLALSEYNNVITELDKKWKSKKDEEIANVYDKIGLLNMHLNKPELALKNYSNAIEQFSERSSGKTTLLKILNHKGDALNKMNSFVSSTKTISFAIKTLDSLKPIFKSHKDKLLLIEDAYPLFESGLVATYNLNESTKDVIYIDQAFKYLEKSKSVLLLESLLSTMATEFANVPQALLERESQLKSEINNIEKQLTKSSGTNDEKQDELFELKKEHRELITTIETNYKRYYNLKYNTKTLSLNETQKLLKPDEKLISYFYGNEDIYAIAVDNASKQIHRIPLNTSLENSIKQMHRMLADSKSDATALGKISYQLYQDLIRPFMTPEGKKKLIIIPDGLLNYIPFGALNTKENSLSYLMESHTISYSNSATLYAQLEERDKKKGKLLAFAPMFSGEQIEVNPKRDKLLPLPHNKREVDQILKSFTGQSYVNENASLQNFTSQLSNYSMLHLATHAVFDDAAPEYSYLAFSNRETEENLLYVSDLYNLQIDADLVTLSACESGVGELKRGEGFLSLARGFFYSGASSIASTLWKVNDASTANLMDAFYSNLSDGNTKDEALQRAKKSFLETNRQNGLSHPYYWSGFIISGNTQALTSPNYIMWIGLAVLFACFSGFFLYRKRQTS